MSKRGTRPIVMAGVLLVSCAAVHAQGLKGEYFNNMTLSGQPALTRTENVGFNWGGASPGDPIGADNFSVRWTGSLTPPESGLYVFSTNSDDGVRLWVGGDSIVNNWSDHSATVNPGAPIYLEAGEPVAIRMEYYENGGDAVAQLLWRGPGIDNQIIPAEFLTPTVTPSVKARKPNPANGALNVMAPLLEWTAGDGGIFHDVYLGTSPDLTAADLVASHQFVTLYYHVMGLTPGVTYYWRVDEIEKDGVTTHAGSVWSFTMQATTAYYPSPVDGAKDASVIPSLTWLPGSGATKHHVYFGDTLEAVQQGAAATDKGIVVEPNDVLAPGALQAMTTYYWRVDEILLGGTVQAGPVWSFTTCLPVDDFESYTDELGSAIFDTWVDGWTNNTGSTVGNAQAPFAELTVVHGGLQSMPLDYNNVNAPFYSETEREFASAQNWTTGGADTLVLSVRGRVGNAPAQLYVAIEDTSAKSAMVAYPDTAITGVGHWIQWKIPLADFAGVNPAKVKKMYIGLGDKSNPAKGGTGRFYIDDIGVIKP
jgi:hypothetical protein